VTPSALSAAPPRCRDYDCSAMGIDDRTDRIGRQPFATTWIEPERGADG
jgi:hypothetical protein